MSLLHIRPKDISLKRAPEEWQSLFKEAFDTVKIHDLSAQAGNPSPSAPDNVDSDDESAKIPFGLITGHDKTGLLIGRGARLIFLFSLVVNREEWSMFTKVDCFQWGVYMSFTDYQANPTQKPKMVFSPKDLNSICNELFYDFRVGGFLETFSKEDNVIYGWKATDKFVKVLEPFVKNNGKK